MKRVRKPFLVAVTGGIASGKSILLNELEKNHFKVYQADQIGHNLFSSKEIKEKLVTVFSDKIVNASEIDRKILGKIIFANKNAREKLNEIIHPEISKEIKKIISDSKEEILIFEIPLLFENQLENDYHFIIHIFSDTEKQIERLKSRNNLSEEEALERISSQLPPDYKIARADLNIANNGTIFELQIKIKESISIIMISFNSYCSKVL